MGWQEFLMKHGIGSPGYIAKVMAANYRTIKEANPLMDELSILIRVYANRVAAQSILGGPAEYRAGRENPILIRQVVERNSNVFLIIRHSILIEHPGFHGRGAPPDRFDVLDRVLAEILDREIPDWRKTLHQYQAAVGEHSELQDRQRDPGPNTAERCRTFPTILEQGLSVAAALDRFRTICAEERPDTLFVTDQWIESRFQRLRTLLSDPITRDQAHALNDAVLKQAKLDDVVEWLAESTLAWRVFHRLKTEGNNELKRMRTEEQKLEYDRKFAKAQLAWKTKANTPWEAAMRDQALQALHDSVAARRKYEDSAHPCPQCKSKNLTWFYFVTPPPPFEHRWVHGFAGWMTACEKCTIEVDFFSEARVHY